MSKSNDGLVRVNIGLQFKDSGYIAQPFWPERNLEINISKDVHPKLGPEKKKAALNAALEKQGITEAEYARVLQRAARPFYTVTDADDGSGEIVIPQRILQSFINNASQTVPKVIPRVAAKGLTFIGVRVDEGFLRTGKTISDAKMFSRFVKLDESNQRSFQENQYITNFTAKGQLILDESIITSEDLKKLMDYAGRYLGIGASRPQGYGRFTVTVWNKE